MRTLFIHASPHVPGMPIATMVAAASLLFGCAVKPTPAYEVSASGCGMNSVLYCDQSPIAERCECARHSDVREIASTLLRR